MNVSDLFNSLNGKTLPEAKKAFKEMPHHGLAKCEAHIRSLKNAGLVERVGAAKGGRWIVKQPK